MEANAWCLNEKIQSKSRSKLCYNLDMPTKKFINFQYRHPDKLVTRVVSAICKDDGNFRISEIYEEEITPLQRFHKWGEMKEPRVIDFPNK